MSGKKLLLCSNIQQIMIGFSFLCFSVLFFFFFGRTTQVFLRIKDMNHSNLNTVTVG